jgi:transposase
LILTTTWSSTSRCVDQQLLPLFAKLAPCLIGMEACASTHYSARELNKLGHNVRLLPGQDVMAYVNRGKNHAIDAAAGCEADRRPMVGTVSPSSASSRHKAMKALMYCLPSSQGRTAFV